MDRVELLNTSKGLKVQFKFLSGLHFEPVISIIVSFNNENEFCGLEYKNKNDCSLNKGYFDKKIIEELSPELLKYIYAAEEFLETFTNYLD